MKRSIQTLAVVALLVFVVILLIVFGRREPPPNGLDLGEIAIDSELARDLFGQDSVRIRNPASDYRPTGAVTVLTLEPVRGAAAREVVDWLVRTYDVAAGELLYLEDVLIVKGQATSLWVHRASGAFKLTRTQDSMTTPSTITAEQAVQVALDHIARKKLLALQDGEELDLLFVSSVKNVVSGLEDVEVDEEFVSDRYVGFGRRYRGIPVVGSKLVVRLNGAGNVAMVSREWRRIEQEAAFHARAVDTPIADLIRTNAGLRERLGDGSSIDTVNIVGQNCGYLEAPADHRQQELRPGCMVSFRIGGGGDEAISQARISLEGDLTAKKR